MKVKDLMTTNINFVSGDATIDEIARQMDINEIGFLPVCQNERQIVGVITDRDIVIKGIAKGLRDCKAKDIMSPVNASASADMDIHQAALLLSKYKLHRLPVVEKDRIVGILSLSDLAKKKLYLCEIGDIYNAFIQQE